MRRASRFLVFGTVLAAPGVAGTYLAYADWTVPVSTAKVTVQAAKMPRGVEPSVAKQSRTAVVSWSAQEIVPGVKISHYLVTAYSVSTPALPDIARSVAASGAATESLAFPAEEVAGGRWYWTITPRLATWTGAESPKSKQLTFPAATPAELAAAVQAVAPVPPAGAVPVAPSAAGPSRPAQPPAQSPVPEQPAEERPTEKTISPPAQQPEQPPVAVEPPSAEPPPSAADPSASGSAPADVPQ